MASRPVPDLRVACTQAPVRPISGPERHFIGLNLDPQESVIHGSLVRVWGTGYQAISDVVATSCLRDNRLSQLGDQDRSSSAGGALTDLNLSEMAESAIQPLVGHLPQGTASLRTASLLGFGQWRQDLLKQWSFAPRGDTPRLAATTGLTILDNFAGCDLAHGGRGGPCEAVGVWMMVADRGIMPGRVIRAVLDLEHTARLYLLPPRQLNQLPTHLMAFDLAPALSLLRQLTQNLTHGRTTFEPDERCSVQAKQIPELRTAWQAEFDAQQRQRLDDHHLGWSPHGYDPEPYMQIVHAWSTPLTSHAAEVLSTAVQWIAHQIANFVQCQLPPSQPVGQLALAGAGRTHGFLLNQLSQQLPEVQVMQIDELGIATSWRSAAAALLGTLYVDQQPGSSPSLTGTSAPRALGRLTPGAPSNWHHVLADLAQTLPAKKTLRSAI